MRNRISMLVLGLVALVFMVGATGGCGTSLYNEVSYQAPDWTPEGLIYFQKAITHYRKEPMGTINQGTDYEYWTMTTEGTNETQLSYDDYPYFSPGGTYVAFISGETISIVRRADDVEVYSFSPTTESITALDWGPDEDKLVYLKDSGGINIVNIDGGESISIASSGEAVAWKYGNKIIFNYTDGLYTYTAIINFDGSQRLNVERDNRVVDPQISKLSTNEVYGTHGNEYGYIDLNSDSPQYTKLISDFNGYLPKLSPEANKITYGALFESGIWIIDIAGGNLTELK